MSQPVGSTPRGRNRRIIAAGLAAVAVLGLGLWLLRPTEAGPGSVGPGGTAKPKPAAPVEGHSLELTVLDDYLRPVEGVAVEAFTAGAPDPKARAQTTPEGIAKLGGLPAGVYELRARKAGYSDEARADVPVGPDPGPPITLTLERTGLLRGRVHGADGMPAQGARVVLRGSGAAEPPSTTTEKDGSFALNGLPSGVYGAQASLGALVSKAEEGIALAAGAEAFVELQLEAAAVLAGRVTDRASGEPLAAKITVEGGARGQESLTLTAEAEGRFETLAPRGATLRVFFEAPGYVPRAELGMAGGPELAVALDRAATLQGIVRDAEGHPVANAEIEVVGEGLGLEGIGGVPLGLSIAPGESLGVSLGPVPKIPLEGASSPVALVGGGLSAGGTPWKTGTDGRFAITPVAPGPLHVVARHASLTPGRSASHDVKPGATLEGLEIELAAGGIVLGEVVDEAGEAVAGVPVELVLDREIGRRLTATDRDGRFAIGPVRGKGQVIAMPPGSPPVEVALEVGAGDEVPVVLRIRRATAALEGEVVGAAGEPVVAAVVRIRIAGSAVARTAVTDSFGVFAVQGLPEETLQLEVEHPDHVLLSIEVKPGSGTLRLELAEGGSLVALLHDQQSGEPIRGALATLRDTNGAVAGKARSNSSGKIEIRSLSSSDYVLTLDHKEYAIGRFAAPVQGDGAVDLGVLELEPAGAATGQVVDQYGGTVAGAEVAAGSPPRWRSAVRTDAKGAFRLAGLPAGEVELVARAGGSLSDTLEVRIDPGSVSEGVVLRIAGAIDQAESEPETHPDTSNKDDTGDPGSEADTRPAPRLSEGIAIQVGYALGKVRIEAVLGPAARQGGLQSGDFLTRVEGENVLAAAQARGLLRGRAGSSAAVEVERNGKRLQLKVLRERY